MRAADKITYFCLFYEIKDPTRLIIIEEKNINKSLVRSKLKKNSKRMNSRFRYASNRFPVTPSIVSSTGRICTLFPYLTSGHWCTETTSPNLTLRFDLTTLFILILGSSHVSSARAMQIVSFLFFP